MWYAASCCIGPIVLPELYKPATHVLVDLPTHSAMEHALKPRPWGAYNITGPCLASLALASLQTCEISLIVGR